MKKSEHSTRWAKAQEEITALKAKIEALNFSTGVIIDAKNQEIDRLRAVELSYQVLEIGVEYHIIRTKDPAGFMWRKV